MYNLILSSLYHFFRLQGVPNVAAVHARGSGRDRRRRRLQGEGQEERRQDPGRRPHQVHAAEQGARALRRRGHLRDGAEPGAGDGEEGERRRLQLLQTEQGGRGTGDIKPRFEL